MSVVRSIAVAQRASLRKRTRVLQNYTDYDSVLPGIANNVKSRGQEKLSNNTFIGASDISDYTRSVWHQSSRLQTIIHRDLNIHSSRSEWYDFIESHNDDATVKELSQYNGIVLCELGYIDYNINSGSVRVDVIGDPTWVNSVLSLVKQKFKIVTSYVDWMYSSSGESVRVPLTHERLPIAEMYPFLNGDTLTSYYDRFLNSTANVLLLIGPPGSGKTTFIRGLLDYSKKSAMVTYDAAILEKDYIFASFIGNDTDIMVMEDCDKFLGSRADGNTMMHKFLNVGDGLVTSSGKKLIFSTNLPSVRDVDPALIRPGRCFDILNFGMLNKTQADILAKKIGVTLEDKEFYSVAEIYNTQTTSPTTVSRKLGFL